MEGWRSRFSNFATTMDWLWLSWCSPSAKDTSWHGLYGFQFNLSGRASTEDSAHVESSEIPSLCGTSDAISTTYPLTTSRTQLLLVVVKLVSRTTPTGDNSPSDKNKAQLFLPRITFPIGQFPTIGQLPTRTTANYIFKNTHHWNQWYTAGGQLSWWEVVQIRLQL